MYQTVDPSQWLYCSDMGEEVICLVLLLSPKSSHHPVQIAINMSKKTTFAQHERVLVPTGTCCRCECMCTHRDFSLLSLL